MGIGMRIGFILIGLLCGVACGGPARDLSGPCDTLQGRARRECLAHQPAAYREAAENPQSLPLREYGSLDRVLQKIDDSIDWVIDGLFD